ncbi:MAG: alpha/beta hydrolase [Lachnospiraceae bacterium]|nr:alpha/beta hydrolase [Lachnospiraceae bacterium]
MLFNAKNGRLNLPSGEMDYISFGRGPKPLIMIPGVGDGLKTVKGMAVPFAVLYRELEKDFTVYVFSRRVSLPEHMTTREMAEDLNTAMDELGLKEAVIVGVSQGGMIAQWLALDHADKVGKLVLTVTLSRPNDTVRDVIARWTEMAHQGDYCGIMLDTAERSYSEKCLKQVRLEYKLLGSVGKPKSFARFLTQAESCITHDTYDLLDQISCPTLVIGGTDDRIVTGEASKEIAERIPGCELYMYEGLGHGLYEEAPDFISRVKEFCM